MPNGQAADAAQSLTYSDSYNSDDADIELISSDQMVFKVHMYRLQFHSGVFQSMISVAKATSQQDTIHLTDSTLEHSKVVKRILDIMYTLDVDIDQSHDKNTFPLVVEFAKKWEMSLIIKLIRQEMVRGLESRSHKPQLFDNFLLALRLGDNELAASYFGAKGGQTWPTIKQKKAIPVDEDSDDSEDDSDEDSDEEESGDDSVMNQATEPPVEKLPDLFLNDQAAPGLSQTGTRLR